MSKSRVVVITGGGSGIGRAIAIKFADAGDIVCILGRDQKKLSAVAKDNKSIFPLAADVTIPESIESARVEITKKHKAIDVLVNCAGGNTKVDPNADIVEANKVWSQIINVNLTGTFNTTFAFLPHLKRPGGRIINVTSLAAFTGSSQPATNGQAYAAAKAGIHGLSRTLANSVSKEAITVNCVAPGVIDHTGFFGGDGVPEDRKAPNIDRTPLGRLGVPEDIAGGVFYLASEEASFITGEILNISGGVVFGR